MSGLVVEFPRMRIRQAREIVANPDLHGASEVLAACRVLLEGGKIDDVRAVLALQTNGVVAGYGRAQIDASRAKGRRERRNLLIGLGLLIAAAVGSVVIVTSLFDVLMAVLS